MSSLPLKILGLLLVLVPLQAIGQTCHDNILETTPDSRFIRDDILGEVTDQKTGLIWKVCSEGQAWDASVKTCTGTATTHTWQEALTLQLQDNIFWRLPSVRELGSIIERKCYSPAINLDIFPIHHYSAIGLQHLA